MKFLIQFLFNLQLTNVGSEYEIQITNNGDIGIYIITNENIDISSLCSYDMIKYLKINNNIVKNDKLIEIFYNNNIFRSGYSFHQNDENIRIKLYESILHEFNKYYIDIMYFIGGEMYIYGILLKKYYDIGYFFSDYQSIVDDTIYNLEYHNFNKYTFNVKLINYSNYTFDHIDYDASKLKTILINNGKQGLGDNLCSNIINLKFDKIFIISCNNKSFKYDYNLLKKIYNIEKQYEFTTNYTTKQDIYSDSTPYQSYFTPIGDQDKTSGTRAKLGTPWCFTLNLYVFTLHTCEINSHKQ